MNASSYLLQFGMADFRENWMRRIHEKIDEAMREHGAMLEARGAVAEAMGIGEQTLYQILARKSNKTWPRAELMVAFEQAYGEGKPAGWSGLAFDLVGPTPGPGQQIVSAADAALLEDIRMLSPTEQVELRQAVRAKAEQIRRLYTEAARSKAHAKG